MTDSSPQKNSGFFQPAEWTAHESCWLAWPSAANLWQEDLPKAQDEFTSLCKAIAEGEKLEILVPDAASQQQAEKALAGLSVRFHRIPFGDIWLRDTAPIFITHEDGRVASARFAFNGWGGKYVLPFDSDVSTKVAAQAAVPKFSFSWILEGGSVEVDGEGTCLTSRQCLLNENRNPGMNQASIEKALRDSLGVTKVLWLRDGLLNDHTDGHIDTIARYVAPGVVACMQATHPARDPNHKVYEEIATDLASFTDAKGRKLKVVRVPSPGEVLNEDGDVMPASFLNFYIGNKTVVVPVYGTPYDDAAVKAIAGLFPTRKTVGLPAIAILTGGGAFHCITQQQPLARAGKGD
jgi:agmatine deiminase